MFVHALGIRWSWKLSKVKNTILLKIPLRKLSFSRYSFWWKMRLTRTFAWNWKYTLGTCFYLSVVGLFKIALSIRITVWSMMEIKIELLTFCVIVLGTRLITMKWASRVKYNARIRKGSFYLERSFLVIYGRKYRFD